MYENSIGSINLLVKPFLKKKLTVNNFIRNSANFLRKLLIINIPAIAVLQGYSYILLWCILVLLATSFL